MTKTQNLQDIFLNRARKSGMLLTMFLMNGFQLRGVVTAFDNFTVTLEAVAQMALETRALCSKAERVPQHLLNKHYFRKHGKNAYYGQK